MNLMAAIAGALFTLGVALLIGAGAASQTVIGIPVAVVLFFAAIAALSTATLFASWAAIGAAQLAVQQAELNTERARFTNDVSAVITSCPPSCWGDLALPSCSE